MVSKFRRRWVFARRRRWRILANWAQKHDHRVIGRFAYNRYYHVWMFGFDWPWQVSARKRWLEEIKGKA